MQPCYVKKTNDDSNVLGCIEMDWIGLDWIGLELTGLNWGLSWFRLGWIGWDRIVDGLG